MNCICFKLCVILSFCIYLFFTSVSAQTCPKEWVDYKDSCYKFTRSPLKSRDEAEAKCRAYAADLVSVNDIEEHIFIGSWLRENDPQHRSWYTSGRDDGDNIWVWDSDNTLFNDVDALFLPLQNESTYRYAAYNYSELANRWGLLKVSGLDVMAFICEIAKKDLHQMIIIERDFDYGLEVTGIEKIPRGPYFVEEPRSVIFDAENSNFVSLKCVASGHPSPIYRWYREEFRDDELISIPVDPLSDSRYTLTDGTLIISNPRKNQDRGNYHCTAENKFGLVVSQTVQLSFGYITEFNKKRSNDNGREFWGKSLSCDPPQHYPSIIYNWARNAFPNFVEQDQRLFISNDGNLYFSALEKVDEAYYSCNVKSMISQKGEQGPLFHLQVLPASSGQKLIFPNNFPKAFPDAPLVGDTVRLECVSYGYPVPSYNWVRKGITSELPTGAYTENYNRVLILPRVRIEDAGNYYCTAKNDLESETKSVKVRIQAKPEFTIPLNNQVVDKGSRLVWTCEAFGKPEVTYSWLRNGKILKPEHLDVIDRNRYRIYDNVLTIDDTLERDQGMYQCKATNHLGSAYSSGQLRVITLKPTFAKYPLDAEMFAAEDGNVTIPCRPEAAPFPTFLWKRENYGISSTNQTEFWLL